MLKCKGWFTNPELSWFFFFINLTILELAKIFLHQYFKCTVRNDQVPYSATPMSDNLSTSVLECILEAPPI